MSAKTIHNLPKAPYKKFFGREETIEKIYKTLVRGGTFIASLDGVGGIGKTALAHHFCSEIILKEERFNYLIWITAKDTVFDAFSQESQIKQIDVNFRGLETLFDELIKVTGFEEEMQDDSLEKKQEFFEEIVTTEPVFFVLDNLETIHNDDFFRYIFEDFNQFSGMNRDLKVLTTSRKRKKIADHPIAIEGLSQRKAQDMLYYFAEHLARKPVLDILNATENDNIRLVERLGCVPLLIEFAVAQLSNGRKTRGQIYEELKGFPSVDTIVDGEERQNIISEIITFQFQNMYESLTKDHTKVLQSIVAWISNPTGDSQRDALSIEKLMGFAGNYSRGQLENLLDDLMDHKFISLNDHNMLQVNMMAVNFVKRKYETFHLVENEVVAFKNSIIRNERLKKDDIDTTIEHVEKQFLEKGKFQEAEAYLMRYLDFKEDPRFYHKIAVIHFQTKSYDKAFHYFETATKLNEVAIQPWLDWIDMEISRGNNRKEMAILTAEKALKKTSQNINILIILIDLYADNNRLKEMRDLILLSKKIYNDDKHKTQDLIRLLKHTSFIERNLPDLNSEGNLYLELINKLIYLERDAYQKLEYLREKLTTCRDLKWFDESRKTQEDILNLESRVLKDLPKQVKKMNGLFHTEKNYEEAFLEAKNIVSWCNAGKYEERDINCFKSAFRILFEVYQKKKEPEKVILIFEDNERICAEDEACKSIYEDAKKALIQQKKEEYISDINTNIQKAEQEIRALVMSVFDDDDSKLIDYLNQKGHPEWVERWKFTRRKAQGGNSSLIHFSDFGQLAKILHDVKKLLAEKIAIEETVQGEKLPKFKNKLSNINKFLHEYVLEARNTAFHSRLPLKSVEELNEIKVDVARLLRLVLEIQEEVGIEKP